MKAEYIIGTVLGLAAICMFCMVLDLGLILSVALASALFFRLGDARCAEEDGEED